MQVMVSHSSSLFFHFLCGSCHILDSDILKELISSAKIW